MCAVHTASSKHAHACIAYTIQCNTETHASLEQSPSNENTPRGDFNSVFAHLLACIPFSSRHIRGNI